MNVMLEEQETIISISRTNDMATIYTSDSTMINKLDKKVKNHPDVWKCKHVERVLGQIVSKWYSCPKKMVSLRNQSKISSSGGNPDALRKYREQKQAGDA